jgi:hypothetical protein
LAGYLFLLLACAGFSLSLLPAHPSVIALSLLGLLLSGCYYYRRYCALSHKLSINNIVLNKDGCRLKSVGGYPLDSELAQGHFISNFLVVLHLTAKDRYFGIWLPIFVDSVAPDLFRQLKVRLRFPDG